MVEESFLPIDFAVAIGALRAETAFMFVVFLVTSKAIRRRVVEFNLGFMAVTAYHWRQRMRALQLEISEFVVE